MWGRSGISWSYQHHHHHQQPVHFQPAVSPHNFRNTPETQTVQGYVMHRNFDDPNFQTGFSLQREVLLSLRESFSEGGSKKWGEICSAKSEPVPWRYSCRWMEPCTFLSLGVNHPFRLDSQRFLRYSIHERVLTLTVTPAHSNSILRSNFIYTASAIGGNQSSRLWHREDIAPWALTSRDDTWMYLWICLQENRTRTRVKWKEELSARIILFFWRILRI